MSTAKKVKSVKKSTSKRIPKRKIVDEDLELINKFKKGCQFSFDEIVKKYETKVHNLAMRLTRNPEDSEEVLQDVFVTVFRKIDGFEGKAKFSSWLYRVTVNASFMILRKRKRKQTVSIEDFLPNLADNALGTPQHFGNQSDSRAISNEMRTELEGAISKLPEEYSAVFVLRDVNGLSNKEVSEILNLSIPAVKSRLHRSRIMLRKKLRKYYEDYTSETNFNLGKEVLRNIA